MEGSLPLLKSDPGLVEPGSLLTALSSWVPVGLWRLGAGACAAPPIGGSRESTARPAGFGLPASLVAAALRSSLAKGIHRLRSDPGLVGPLSLFTAPSSLVPVGHFPFSREAGAAAPIGGTRECPAWLSGFGLPAFLMAPALCSSWPKGIHRFKRDPGLVELGSLLPASSYLEPVVPLTLGGGAGAGTPMGESRVYTARPAVGDVSLSLFAAPSSLVPVGVFPLGGGAGAHTQMGGSRVYTAWPAGLEVPSLPLASPISMVTVSRFTLGGGAGAAAQMGGTQENPTQSQFAAAPFVLAVALLLL